MLIYGETNFALVRTLYVLDCHRRRDIRPSRLYVSPRTRLGSIGSPRRALGARKYSVGRTRIIRIRMKSNQITMRVLSPMWEVALVKSILQAETTNNTICCNMLKYYLVVMQTLGYLQLFLAQRYTM